MNRFQQISKAGNNTDFGDEPHMIARDGSAYTMPGSNRSDKAFLGFNVFLNDDLVAEEIEETEHLFTSLPSGDHTAGVQSVYTTGTSEVQTIDFNIELIGLTLEFLDGYTWFSINVEPLAPGSMHANDLFADLEPAVDDRILGQTESAVYTGEEWFENIEIDPKQRYVMDLTGAQSLVVEGNATPIEPINLFGGDPEGYTWLGYLPQSCMEVDQALDISPAPAQGDRIFMPGAFAEYFEDDWSGTLNELCPGEGYTIAMSEDAVLSYPGASKDVEVSGSPEVSYSPAGLQAPHNMRHTMTMLAQLQLPDGKLSTSEKDMVYAFVGNECRGMASPDASFDGRLLMSIAANIEEGEEVRFKVWLSDREEMVEIMETVVFEALSGVGLFDDPLLLTTGEALDSGDLHADSWAIGEAYPNPFTEVTHIPYVLDGPAEVALQVYTLTGQVVYDTRVNHLDGGRHEIRFNRQNLNAGVYFYTVEINGDRESLSGTGRMVITE